MRLALKFISTFILFVVTSDNSFFALTISLLFVIFKKKLDFPVHVGAQ